MLHCEAEKSFDELSNAEYFGVSDKHSFHCIQYSQLYGTELWASLSVFAVVKWDCKNKFSKSSREWRFDNYRDAHTMYCHITGPSSGWKATGNLHMVVEKGGLVDPLVTKFLKFVLKETATALKHLTLRNVTARDVHRYISILEDISFDLKSGKSSDLVSLLPFSVSSLREVSENLDLCQLMLDHLLLVPNSTYWEFGDIYNALGCKVRPVGEVTIRDNEILGREFAVDHPLSRQRVTSDRVTVYHLTPVRNLLSILSRGFVTPSMVLEDLGVERRDRGYLGHGVYFSPTMEGCMKYRNENDPTVIVKCCVAPGKIYETSQPIIGLTRPPFGYDSVMAISKTDDANSYFEDPELCLFDPAAVEIVGVIALAPHHNPPVDNQTQLPPTLPQSEKACSIVNGILDGSCVDSTKQTGLLINNTATVHGSLTVQAELTDLAAQVTLVQTYSCELETQQEARYVFPLSEGCAVCGFEAYIGRKHVVGRVQRKEEARKRYRKAVKEGDGAYLLEQEKPDMFSVSLGNIPAGSHVIHIKITYVTELRMEGDLVVFRIPGQTTSTHAVGVQGRFTQETTATHHVTNPPSSFSFTGVVTMPFKILRVSSPGRRLSLKRTDTVWSVRWAGELGEEEFVLQISLAEVHRPRMWVERCGESEAAMLTFYPQIEMEQSAVIEVVMVVSCACSQNWLELIALATLFVRSLPRDCFFNIVAIYPANRIEIFPRCCEVSDKNLNSAERFLSNLQMSTSSADLHSLLSSRLATPTSPQTITNYLLISDGSLLSPGITLSLAERLPDSDRIISAVITPAPNQHLLETLAVNSGGAHHSFDIKGKSKWKSGVSRLLTMTTEPSLGNAAINWKVFGLRTEDIRQSPLFISALYNNTRLTVFGFLPNCRAATLSAMVGGQEIDTIVSCPDLNVTTGTTLHRLAAKSVIEDYFSGRLREERVAHERAVRDRREEIVEMSLEHSILCPLTSFIAVEEREEREVMETTVELSEVLGEVDKLPYMGWSEEEDEEMQGAQVERKDEVGEVRAEVQFGQHQDIGVKPSSNQSKNAMNSIKVQDMTGRVTEIDLNRNMTIDELKNTLEFIGGIPRYRQRLIYEGRQLEGDRTLGSYQIENGDTIHSVLRITGGGGGYFPPRRRGTDDSDDGDESSSSRDNEQSPEDDSAESMGIQEDACSVSHGTRSYSEETPVSGLDSSAESTQYSDSEMEYSEQDEESGGNSEEDMDDVGMRSSSDDEDAPELQLYARFAKIKERSQTSQTKVVPVTLSVVDHRGVCHTLIRRNTTVPAESSVITVLGGKSGEIAVFAGENKKMEDNLRLGAFCIHNLPICCDDKVTIFLHIDLNYVVSLRCAVSLSEKFPHTLLQLKTLSLPDAAWIERHLEDHVQDDLESDTEPPQIVLPACDQVKPSQVVIPSISELTYRLFLAYAKAPGVKSTEVANAFKVNLLNFGAGLPTLHFALTEMAETCSKNADASNENDDFTEIFYSKIPHLLNCLGSLGLRSLGITVEKEFLQTIVLILASCENLTDEQKAKLVEKSPLLEALGVSESYAFMYLTLAALSGISIPSLAKEIVRVGELFGEM